MANECRDHETPEPAGDRILRLIHWTSAAGRQLRRRLAAVGEAFQLSDHELLVIWFCREAGWVQVELAAAVGVSPAQMSGIVERLRRRGLVEMERSPLDRRRQVWRTADAGTALLASAGEVLQQLEQSLSRRMSSQDQAAVQRLCLVLAEAAGEAQAGVASETTAGSRIRQNSGAERSSPKSGDFGYESGDFGYESAGAWTPGHEVQHASKEAA